MSLKRGLLMLSESVLSLVLKALITILQLVQAHLDAGGTIAVQAPKVNE